jgi:hypothetical protein
MLRESRLDKPLIPYQQQKVLLHRGCMMLRPIVASSCLMDMAEDWPLPKTGKMCRRGRFYKLCC